MLEISGPFFCTPNNQSMIVDFLKKFSPFEESTKVNKLTSSERSICWQITSIPNCLNEKIGKLEII